MAPETGGSGRASLSRAMVGRMGVSKTRIFRVRKNFGAKTPCGATKITLNPDHRNEGPSP